MNKQIYKKSFTRLTENIKFLQKVRQNSGRDEIDSKEDNLFKSQIIFYLKQKASLIAQYGEKYD